MRWKLAVILIVPILILMAPVPSGLSPDAWHVLAVSVAAILGIMLRPAPEPVVVLVAISASALAFGNLTSLLSGYASATAWLVFAAFLSGQVFVDTGLGRRIAYVLLGRMGRSTLALGYAAAFTDLILSPATASNTARTGGIVYPIFRSISVSVGSEAGPTARRLGAYLTILLYQISLTTGFMFITAIAPNAITIAIGKEMLNVEVSWLLWAKAAIVPGLAVHHLFASMATFVAAFVPVLFALGLAAKAPVMPLFFIVALSSSFGCLLTHYGGAVGPVLFGTGYVDQVTWWKIGTVVVLLNAAVCLLIGLPYWKLIGLW